ncbi:hypothetical protein IL54_1403 [Sphingobium sp. ba1]|nr:hypothetical protein IL54_1403 [Sphingobium sp. ba1]
MAFIDFAQPMAGAPLSACLPMADMAEAATLDPLEWQVVALARSDRLSTLRRPGSWDKWSALILGPRPSPVLASERLEALRRLSVEAWHRGYAVTPSALADAQEAGFTADQLELLLATISAGRSARGRKVRP